MHIGLHEAAEKQLVFPASRLAKEILEKKRRPNGTWTGCYMWDPLAAVLLLEPETASFKTTRLDVEPDPESVYAGRTLSAESGPEVRFAHKVEQHRFEELFFEALRY